MEQMMQKPYVDSKRVKKIRQALIKAYSDKESDGLKNAVFEAQKYIDDGGDCPNIDDSVENYDGSEPEKLADMYLLRLLRDRHCDDDDDKEYIKTGLTRKMRIFHTIRCCGKEFTQKEWGEYCSETYADPSKRIVTSFGKYDFNDFDMCLNPTVMSLVVSHGYSGYEVTLKWCNCGNGMWTYGMRFNCGLGGGGYGCSWSDKDGNTNSRRKGYKTENECIIACCDDALVTIEHNGGDDIAKKNRLIAMIKDYRKSIIKPAPIQLSLFDF